MRLQNYSIRVRLAFFIGVTVGLLCIMFSAALLFTLNRMATQNLTKEVTAAGELTAYYIDHGRFVNPLPPIPHNLIRPIQVVDPQGRVAAATSDLQNKPAMAHFTPKPPRQVASAVVCNSVLTSERCNIVVAQRVYRDGDWIIYSAAPVLPFYVYPGVMALLIVGTVVFTVAVAYGARRTVTSSLKPVDSIRVKLDDIHSTSLGRRVPVPTAQDEIYRLARSINHTLDRLEAAQKQQRRFSSDASHELRTPITAMRAQLEDALLAPQDTDLSTLCRAVLPSLERLQSLASDLLTLTRLEVGTPYTGQLVDLAELVAEELNDRRTTKKVVHHLTPGVTVRGDRSQLSRLINNLVDNAGRHASSAVVLTVRREDDGSASDSRFPAGIAALEVLDDGKGIPDDQRETVFQRFTRLDTARSRDAGGVGLGLTIARQIAESHGGTLTIRDGTRGACFVVRLPMSS